MACQRKLLCRVRNALFLPLAALTISCALTTGCVKVSKEPEIFLSHTTFPEAITKLPDPPPALVQEECASAWAQEYTIGKLFASEGDYYRAATCFHRARHMLGTETEASFVRKAQLVRALVLTYMLAGKPQEAIEVWEKEQDKIQFTDKNLAEDTLSLLFEAYHRLNRQDDAEKLLRTFSSLDILAQRLHLFHAIAKSTSTLPFAQQYAEKNELQKELETCLKKYHLEAKNPTSAAVFNALLPGAGYWYVGQYQTATTALLLNALFIGTTVEFFAAKLPAAALLSAGFEIGWYGGGIIGAKLAAEMYNQRLREVIFKSFLEKYGLFPIQTLHYQW